MKKTWNSTFRQRKTNDPPLPCFTHKTVETTRWRKWIGFESDDYEEGCSVGATVSVKLSLFLEYTPLQNFNYVCFKTPVSVTWGAGIDVCHFIRPSTPHDACARSARVYLLFNARTSQGCLFRCITSHTSKLSFFMHKHRYKQTQQVLPHVHVSFFTSVMTLPLPSTVLLLFPIRVILLLHPSV